MKVGRLMSIHSQHPVSVAEAAAPALEGYFTPAVAEAWESCALWQERTYVPAGGNPRQPGPALKLVEWQVEQFSCSIHNAAGEFYQGRRIYLFAYKGPGMYHRLLPGYHYSNLGIPAHIHDMEAVDAGVGVQLAMLNIACATDIIRTSILYREVSYE